MSIIFYHVSAPQAAIPLLSSSPDTILDAAARSEGIRVMDIDKAYEAIGWLTSPLKREETKHMTRLISDPDWSDDEARASVTALSTIPVDDVLAALEGRTSERIASIDYGMGPSAFFPPIRVCELSKAISALSEDMLRAESDYKEMDEQDVTPSYWLEEGDEILATYLFPALRRLKQFYASASERGDAILVVIA